MHKTLGILIVNFFLFILFAVPAFTATSGSVFADCSDVEAEYFSSVGSKVDVNDILIGCLMNKLSGVVVEDNGTIKTGSTSSKDVTAINNRDILLKYAGALRNIRGDGTDPEIIKQLRNADSIAAIRVLAAAARSDDKITRVYSALILSSIIDNSTACVVLDNLFDEDIATTEHGIIGRANLLGIVRSLARWAYKENFDTIKKVIDFTEGQLQGQVTGVEKTRSILADLEDRISPARQLSNSIGHFADQPIPDSLRAGCEAYLPRFADKSQMSYANRDKP